MASRKIFWHFLSIESYAKVRKRNGDDNELDSLKIMPLNGI